MQDPFSYWCQNFLWDFGAIWPFFPIFGAFLSIFDLFTVYPLKFLDNLLLLYMEQKIFRKERMISHVSSVNVSFAASNVDKLHALSRHEAKSSSPRPLVCVRIDCVFLSLKHRFTDFSGETTVFPRSDCLSPGVVFVSSVLCFSFI